MSQCVSLGQIPCHASAGSATTRGAVRLHVGLDHEGLLPACSRQAFVAMTEGKSHDLSAARALQLPRGSIVVMDRGYTDYAWYNQLNNNGISFVTRLKTNARYRVIASAGSATVSAEPCSKPKGWPAIKPSRSPAPGQNIASSGFVLPAAGRRIGYKDADTGIHYTFLTNNFTLAASTIADIYKARWQVELFFKWSKQNLKVKSFLGASKNAVMTQIWVAMCVYLLLSYIKFLNHIQPSLQQMFRLLQLNLFERRDLLELLGRVNNYFNHSTMHLQVTIAAK